MEWCTNAVRSAKRVTTPLVASWTTLPTTVSSSTKRTFVSTLLAPWLVKLRRLTWRTRVCLEFYNALLKLANG